LKHRKAGDFRDVPVPDNAERRIGAMMSARWTALPAPPRLPEVDPPPATSTPQEMARGAQ
jgi:hypothetical protein